MKKSRFTIVLLCGIFSLVFLAAVEIIWAVDTYKNMRNAYRNQIESIFEEATWQYVTRHPNGDYTLPNIERLHTILKEELRTSGIECRFAIAILAPISDTLEPIWEISNESLTEQHIDFDKSFPPLTIRLTVDDPHTTIIASMRLIVILQMLSILILIATFVYLLQTLFRAKSLEQIRRDLTHNILDDIAADGNGHFRGQLAQDCPGFGGGIGNGDGFRTAHGGDQLLGEDLYVIFICNIGNCHG